MTSFEEGDCVTHCLRGPGTVVREKGRRHRHVVDFDRKAEVCHVLGVNLEPQDELVGEGDC